MEINAILIDPADNVVTLTTAVAQGDAVVWADGSLKARGNVPFGHKVAICAIGAGARVLKYGHPIGTARGALQPGDLVHSDQLTLEGQ